jgi:hypothetical protein
LAQVFRLMGRIPTTNAAQTHPSEMRNWNLRRYDQARMVTVDAQAITTKSQLKTIVVLANGVRTTILNVKGVGKNRTLEVKSLKRTEPRKEGEQF